MSNSLATSSIVAKTALSVLKNSLGFARNVNRDFEDEFKGNLSRGYAPGATINIKRPPRYVWRSGRIAAPQATTETTIPLTLTQGGVDIAYTALERTVSLTQLEDKIKAAMAPVINQIDAQGLELVRTSVYNAVGTIGTLPTTQAAAIQTITQANQRLAEMAAPDGMNTFIVNPAMNASLIQGMAGLFNPQPKISSQFTRGVVSEALGGEFFRDQNVAFHTNGTCAAGTNINGANQIGSTVTVNAITGTITRGTVITLPGVQAVNPQNRTTTGASMQFVVTADVANGATSIPISPAIVTSGPFQNVTASPTSGSAFTILGAASAVYAANVAYAREAFTLAMVPLYMPNSSGAIETSTQSDDGFTVRVMRYFDPVNDVSNMRLDVLYGWAATYPELACKIVA